MFQQVTGATAILVSETNATSYYQGGPFQLGPGPATNLAFSASDDDAEFASFGAQYNESFGAGRQIGTLTDANGAVFEAGTVSLDDVLILTDPDTGDEIQVGRVSMRLDDGTPGSGVETQNFYIFNAPIDPAKTYTISQIDYSTGSGGGDTYRYDTFNDSAIICFAAGTLIETAHGQKPVDGLRPGDWVQTLDNGLQQVAWTGLRRLTAAQLATNSALSPVLIAPGAVGNAAALLVSQQHRILLGDHLVKARHLPLIPGCRARIALGKRWVSYHHILLERHEVLIANGAPAESLFLGPVAEGVLARGAMGAARLTGIRHDRGPYGGSCREMVRRHALAGLGHHAA